MTGNGHAVRAGIRRRLTRSLGLTIALSLAATLATIWLVTRGLDLLSRDTSQMTQVMVVENDLSLAIHTQETFAFDYALSRSNRAIEELRDAQQAELDAYTELARLMPADSGVLDASRQVRDLAQAWRIEWLGPFLESVEREPTIDYAAAIESNETYFVPVEDAMTALEGILENRRTETIATVNAAAPSLAAVLIPIGIGSAVVLILLGYWLSRTISRPLQQLDSTAQALVAGEEVTFVAERDDEIGSLATVLEQLRLDARQRYGSAVSEAEQAATFNRLADLTSFARDESELVGIAVRTFARITPSERGDILLVNNSTNRLVVSAAWGDDPPEIGTLADVDRIDRCPGIRRATAFVANDLSDSMTVHCPVHPADRGSVLCLPMQALGNTVGVVHLESPVVNAYGGEVLGLAARVAEQVGLAIANSRLIKTMESLAMTDPLTGLRNARFFDSHLEQELAVGEREKSPVGLIMLDVDHFKNFNDDFGHPAGDEALRTLARVVRSTIRTSDVVARYGGEEFMVALRRANLEEAVEVAEKLRAAIEQSIVELGPGRYGRITASFGVVSTDVHHLDQKGLLALVDSALYAAKEAGRNRVVAANVTDRAVQGRRKRAEPRLRTVPCAPAGAPAGAPAEAAG